MRRAVALSMAVLVLGGCAEGGSALSSIGSAGVAAAVGSAINPAVGLVAGVATAYVQVARSFGAAIPCKDIVFTVEDDGDLYAATLCRNGAGPWRWATAEPTVRRWGTLQ
jgi:hypothetical protein